MSFFRARMRRYFHGYIDCNLCGKSVPVFAYATWGADTIWMALCPHCDQLVPRVAR